MKFQSLDWVDVYSGFNLVSSGRCVSRCFNPSTGLMFIPAAMAHLAHPPGCGFNPSTGLMFIPAPCSHCPTAQRAIWGFLPLWGVKGAKNRERGCKKRAFLLGFSYLRASPIWPDFGSWQAGQICAFLASRTRHNAKLPLVTDLLQAIASVTASRVAYCDARNGSFHKTLVVKVQLTQ